MTEKIPMIADVRAAAAAAALPPFVMDTAMGPQLAKECAARLSHSWEMDSASSPTVLTGIASSQKALALSAAMQSFRTAIVVVPEQKDIFRWEEDLAFFLPETPIYSFPLVEETGFQVTFSGSERLRDRMRTLGAMLTGRPGIILVTAVEAAQKVVSPSQLEESAFQVSVGEEIGWNALQEKLTSAGYERVDQVERCGHFAVRGDIIDIFPINEEHPVRIELFDDEVDSVRLFDEDTQRSIDDRKSPLDGQGGGEALVFSYLSKALVFYDEPQRCEEALKRYFKEDAAHKKAALSWKEVIGQARKAKNKEIVCTLLKRKLTGFDTERDVAWQGHTMTNYQRQIPIFMEDLKNLLAKGRKVLSLAPRPSEERELSALFSDFHIPESRTLEAGKVTLIHGLLSEGFELTDDTLAVITAGDVLGKQKVRRVRSGPKGKQIRYFSDLNPGDYVVQATHGIGKYLGIRTIELSGIHRDYITIQYAGNDKLYLPVEKISSLEKYIGPEGETPKLHDMGSSAWTKARAKAKKSI